MKQRKKLVIALIALACVLLLVGATAIIGHRLYAEAHKTLPYGFGKDVKVILLAGQSNAAGCSSDVYLQKNVSPEQHARYTEGFDNVYIKYFTSGTHESQNFVKCGACQGEYGGYFGPELGLAEKLNEQYPDETFIIIKYAWGGTNLYEQWRSPSSGGETGPLYRSFVQYVKDSVAILESKNYDVSIEAMCWMQGESDSLDAEVSVAYATHLENFVKDVRADLADYAADDGMAFVDAYIAESFFWKNYKQINAAKQAVADSSPMNAVIDTIAHGLSVTEEPQDEPDIAHYDSMSELTLGYLFAEACFQFLD